jgi:hypothetical protein
MKKYKKLFITLVLIGTGFIMGNENGKQEILERWENRFDSDWYHWQDVETFILGE